MKKIGEKNKQKISFPNKRNGKSSVSSRFSFVRKFSILFHSKKNEYFLHAKNVAFAREPDVGKGTRAAKIRSRFSLYKGENLFGLFFILSLFSLVFLPRNFFPFRHSADCSERKTQDELFDREEYVETMETSCIKFARIRHDHQMSDTLFE